MNDEKYCVIVDPYISAAAICEALHAQNIKIIALISHLKISEIEKNRRFPKHLFDLVYNLNEATIKLLDKLDIVRVISGTDASVVVADQLANRLTQHYANSTSTSAMRHNKYLMQERLKEKNLPFVQQVYINNKILTQEDKDLISAKLKFPVFMKPVSSLCTYGAKKCNNITELEKAIYEVMGTSDFFGEKVIALTIQHFLSGDEYFVDTVSLGGIHKIVSVFRYNKIYLNEIPIYRHAEIVAADSEPGRIAIKFVTQVLDTLGLANGFGHTEIFLTANGPYLTELNPRISGFYGCANKLANLIYGFNQAKLMAESIIDPNKFIDSYIQAPKLLTPGMFICLQVWADKKLKKFNLAQARTLTSFKDHLIIFPEGSECHIPQTLSDTIGYVLLANKDRTELNEDYQKILQWERENVLF